MCGIVAVFGNNDTSVVRRMCDKIRHRGPDDEGVWGSNSGASLVALGHRRLSIIDLSSAGNQPMMTEDAKVILVFNGEIYNYRELKGELIAKGHLFRTNTDTEVILHAWKEWGKGMLVRFNGIFSIAIWDVEKQIMFLARDRFGVKPLYYFKTGETWVFASEIKALLIYPGFNKELDHEAILAMCRYRYCPKPLTLFKHVRKLPPATWMELSSNGETSGLFYEIRYDESHANVQEREVIEELRHVLFSATERQLVADVPVGYFLSGGLDSSALVAMASRSSATSHAKSFTIGFRMEDQQTEGQEDDLEYARKVAKLFDLSHQEIILEPKIVELLPKVLWHLDEPISDPASIASYMISEEASKQGIKVLLSGQGGDEVFAGYPWHLASSMAGYYRSIPSPVRNVIKNSVGMLHHVSGRQFVGMARRLNKFVQSIDDTFEKSLKGFLSYADDATLSILFGDKLQALTATGWPDKRHDQLLSDSEEYHWINRMLHLDFGTFLPSLNLAYTDKTSMAHSVEVRVPLIDNEVVEFMSKVRVNQKLRGTTRKYLFKKSMEGILPHEIIYRKKGGFGAPIRTWLKGELAEMLEDYLSETKVVRRGIFDPKGVQFILSEHKRSEKDHSYLLYFLLSFEIWCSEFLDASN